MGFNLNLRRYRSEPSWRVLNEKRFQYRPGVSDEKLLQRILKSFFSSRASCCTTNSIVVDDCSDEATPQNNRSTEAIETRLPREESNVRQSTRANECRTDGVNQRSMRDRQHNSQRQMTDKFHEGSWAYVRLPYFKSRLLRLMRVSMTVPRVMRTCFGDSIILDASILQCNLKLIVSITL